MKSKVKIVALLLVVLLIIGTSIGCNNQNTTEGNNKPNSETPSNGKTNFNSSGLPIVNEPITLKMMAVKGVEHGDWDNMLLWQVMEEKTNIKIEWEQIPKVAKGEKLTTTLASGEYPEAFWGFGISPTLQVQYGQEGAFVDLSQLIDKFAPNFKKYMDERSEIRKGVVAPDGKIYSLPQVIEDPYGRMDKFFINQKWLDAVNMPKPTTTDELYEVLKAFRDKDPNGNGEQDEIPFASHMGFEGGGMPNFFKGSFGLMNRGTNHSNVDVDASGELRFIPIDPRYKELVEYLHMLYSEKLIYQEIFTQISVIEFQAGFIKDGKSILGSNIIVNDMFCTPKEDFTYLDAPLIGPHGDQLYSDINAGLSDGAFVMTSKNEHLEETMRWVDYFYGDEGAELMLMGVEGVTFKKDENGDYRYLDELINAPEGFFQAISQYTVWSGAQNAGIRSVKYGGNFNNYSPLAVGAAKLLEPYIPDEIWPPFRYTNEENDKMVGLESDINGYVTEMVAAFVSGNTPISEWDNYVSTIEAMGLDEYLKIYQAAYERYSKLE